MYHSFIAKKVIHSQKQLMCLSKRVVITINIFKFDPFWKERHYVGTTLCRKYNIDICVRYTEIKCTNALESMSYNTYHQIPRRYSQHSKIRKFKSFGSRVQKIL